MSYAFGPLDQRLPWSDVHKLSNQGWRDLLSIAYKNGWKPRLPPEAEDWPRAIEAIEWAYEYRNDCMSREEVKEFVVALEKSNDTIAKSMVEFLKVKGTNGIRWA